MINMKKISHQIQKEEVVHLLLSKGLSIHSKEVHGKVTFYEKEMVKILLRKKFTNKYQILIKHLYFFTSTDDDSGTALEEALNEIQKFRTELQNKYYKILTKKEVQALQKKLALLEQEMMEKLYILRRIHLKEVKNTQNRGK